MELEVANQQDGDEEGVCQIPADLGVCVCGVGDSPYQLIHDIGFTRIPVLRLYISDHGTIRGEIKRARTSFSTRASASGSLVTPPAILVRTPTKSGSWKTDATSAFVVGPPFIIASKLALKPSSVR